MDNVPLHTHRQNPHQINQSNATLKHITIIIQSHNLIRNFWEMKDNNEEKVNGLTSIIVLQYFYLSSSLPFQVVISVKTSSTPTANLHCYKTQIKLRSIKKKLWDRAKFSLFSHYNSGCSKSAMWKSLEGLFVCWVKRKGESILRRFHGFGRKDKIS